MAAKKSTPKSTGKKPVKKAVPAKKPAPAKGAKAPAKPAKKAAAVKGKTSKPAKKAAPAKAPQKAIPVKKATPSKTSPSKSAPAKKAAPVKAPAKTAPAKKAAPTKSTPAKKAAPAKAAAPAKTPAHAKVTPAPATKPEPAKATPVKEASKKVVAAKPTPPAAPAGPVQPIGGTHTTAFVEKQKQRLLDLRDELVDAMTGTTRDTIRNAPEGSEASGSGMHQGDAGSDAYDRDFALSVLAKEQDALYEIEQALHRIKKGTYGICEMSSRKIPTARLEAIPFARLTVECQAQWEKEYGNRRFRPSNEVGFSGGNYADDEDSDTVSLDEDDD
jgi:DnaK suppressor protein